MLDAMIDAANSAGARWITWVASATVDAGVLLGLIGLVWLAIRKRVAPQVGYCLFLLVPLKLLMPVAISVPAVVAKWTPSSWVDSQLAPVRVLDAGDRSSAAPPAVAAAGADQSAPLASPPAAPMMRVVIADADPPVPANLETRPRGGPVLNSPSIVSPQSSRLSLSAIAMLAWIVAVLILVGRFAVAQWTFRVRLRQARVVDASRWGIDMRELCQCAGAAREIPMVECDGIAAPAVWGIARPTILLPEGILGSLTHEQLRWVLFHELAHVRRRDLIVVLAQRMVAIVHFFNPVVWIANRIIHQLREYACDDLAVALSELGGVEPGEAFVRVLRYAGPQRSKLEGALGVLGLDARTWCLRRARRLLDTDRPIRTRLGLRSACALVLLALLALPHLRAAGEAPQATADSDAKNTAAPKAAESPGPDKDFQEFALTVVGPDKKPVANAQVEVRTDPARNPLPIRRGTPTKRRAYGTSAETDTEGRLVVDIPRSPGQLDIFITTPGYGPYWAGWSSASHAEAVPAQFTAELEAGWSLGAIVVDDAGKPVEGVTVSPSIEFKKRPGVVQQFGSGAQVKTDAAGKWHFESVPASLGEVFVEMNHPAFLPVRRSLSRAAFGIERGKGPATKIALERGLTVTGKVTDESGKPIVGARVYTKFLNNLREATTGADGTYKLIGCEPRAARLVVAARGRATDMKSLNIEAGMAPIDFVMKPGGTVRIRVVDEQGKPVPRARIFFQRWREPTFSYFEFDKVDQYADKNGVWVWHEAPLDEFRADICPPDGMQLVQQSLIAREEEYVFRVPSALVVSGNVIDAETRKPIKQFRVVTGQRGNQNRLQWYDRGGFMASDGHYEVRESRVEGTQAIKIEADGYLSAVSRDIKFNEGTVTVDFALSKGLNVAARVFTPNAVPAKGAKVALGIAGSQISIKNGDIDDTSTYSPRETTDELGRFHFPAQSTNFQLVITHPSGFAHIKSTPDWDRTRIIRLEPWSRVEGTFRVGKSAAGNVALQLNAAGPSSYGKDVPSIFTHYQSTTGPDGRFAFDRVFPGPARIGRGITLMVDQGATEVTSSCMIAAEFPAGKTVHLDLGGTGRAIVGALEPPKGFKDKVRWNFALVTVMADRDEARATAPYITASVGPDGRFRIDDVPPGDYMMRVDFHPMGPGGLHNHRLKVPPAGAKPADEPVDLGPLTLEGR